jgi:hypothetical protein
MWDEIGKHIWHKVEPKTDNKIWMNTAIIITKYHNTVFDGFLQEYDFTKIKK